MCSFWNLETDTIISVQCDVDKKIIFLYKNHTITVIFNKTHGVSVNRNILIDNCTSDIGVFIDDDCSMVSGYEAVINDFYQKHDCDYACFNGFLPIKNRNELIHKESSKKITCFHDISSVGAPGFSGKISTLKKNHLRFNEKIGTPNFIVLGEDSLFVKDVFDSKCVFYRSNSPVFKIEDDLDNSSYFKGFNDYRFLISKGYVGQSIYKNNYHLLKFIYAFKLTKKNNLKFLTNLRLLDIGISLCSPKNKRKIVLISGDQKKKIIRLSNKILPQVYFKIISNIYDQQKDINNFDLIKLFEK